MCKFYIFFGLVAWMLFNLLNISVFAQNSYLDDALSKKLDAPLSITEKFKGLVEPSNLEITKNFPFRATSEALMKLKSDSGGFSRNLNDARLFQRVSPSVVLIVAGDSLGSGALIDRNGLVITNWHIISGSKDVAVIFKPDRDGGKISKADVRTAVVIKYDEISDLALLKITTVPAKVTPVRLGSLSDIGVGIDVHAIGHPTGEAWTYTKGVISQYRESYEWSSPTKKHKASVIQTQTPINPGSSGGPLLVDSGVMIGVNSFKSIGTEGQNFAVSIDEVKSFLARSENRVADAISPKVSPKLSANTCKAKELSRGENSEKTGTVIRFDLDCDGVVDSEFRTPYDINKPIQYVVDRNDDGTLDVIVFDMKRNGKWEFSFWDNDFDGAWDLVGFHDDGSIIANRYESYDKVNSELVRKK